MTMPDSFWDSSAEPAARLPRDRAYFLNLLGDGHHGLGRHEAAIEAYHQAADGFQSLQARCSHVPCLFKIAPATCPWASRGARPAPARGVPGGADRS